MTWSRRGDFPVHERVQKIILSGGKENQLHHAIIGLFGTPEALAVVTTNFDRLLTSAAGSRWPGEVRQHVAPALPLGEDATGVVYLHGAVGENPTNLVVTDKDFGRAYLTRGYARRFLVELFSNRVVLFIGHSHRDIVLTYLARGLPPKAEPRFALVRASEADRWRELSVEPVIYPTRKGQARCVPLRAPLVAWGLRR